MMLNKLYTAAPVTKSKENNAILIVDDEESLRLTFQMFLIRDGYGSVLTAPSYDEALLLLKNNHFDLIISDIVLQGSSGIDLLRSVKEQGLDCPVVMVTGYPNINTASEAVRLGAFDYLAKPVKKEDLLRTARLALHQYNLSKENEKLTLEKERYQQYLETIFRSIKELVVTVDASMVVLDMNEEAQKWFKNINPGRQTLGAINTIPGFSEIFTVDAQRVLENKIEVAEHRVEINLENQDIKVFRVSGVPMLSESEEFLGVVLVARDVSELEQLSRRKKRTGLHKLIGSSQAMENIFTLIENVGKVDTTVLVTGESGTGKELVAEALHFESPRKNMPLIKVACTAMPENLLESELFGHKKGSFTGAERDRQGFILQADGGTLFLDEIGDISALMQLRLLRFLQDRTFYPVGEDHPIHVDVRLIAATNADLQKKVQDGSFREDLYYRLKVLDIILPPLRRREGDIQLLAQTFIGRFKKRFQKNIHSLSDQALELMQQYRWPGNVRELEHIIERACVLCSGVTITTAHLPPEITQQDDHKNPDDFDTGRREQNNPTIVPGNEKDRILAALQRTFGNKAQAARILGIDRSTLYRKMSQLQIDLTEINLNH